MFALHTTTSFPLQCGRDDAVARCWAWAKAINIAATNGSYKGFSGVIFLSFNTDLVLLILIEVLVDCGFNFDSTVRSLLVTMVM